MSKGKSQNKTKKQKEHDVSVGTTDPVEETSVPTFCRTTSLKVVGEETKLELFHVFDEFTKVCSSVKDKIFSLKDNETTSQTYKDYVSVPQRGRNTATTVFKTKKENITSSFAVKHMKKGKFPFYVASSAEYDFATRGYHYSATAAIHMQLDSLNECDERCNKEYTDKKEEVERFDKALRKEYSDSKVDACIEFVNKTMLSGWAYDGNFVKFFNQVMLPGLKNGTIPYRGTYKIGDKSKRYSFYNPKIADSIAANPNLWDLLADEHMLGYFNALRLLLRKKEHAQYTKTTLLNAPVRPVIANNGVKFSMSSDSQYAYMTLPLPEKDNVSKKLQIKLAYRKVSEDGNPRKSCYLSGLVITENSPDSTGPFKGTEGTYTCQYSVNGKRPQIATLKECFMRLVIRNHQWFNKYVSNTLTPKDGPLKSSYFDLYIDLSLGIKEDPIHDLTAKEVGSGNMCGKNSLKAFYSRSYPEITNLGNQKNNTEPFVCPVNKKHYLMGIDLGQRNPFAYCVKDNDGNLIAKGHVDGSYNDYYKNYISFGNLCEKIIRLIKETKNYLYGDDEAIDIDNFETSVNGKFSYSEYKTYLDSQRPLVNKENQSLNNIHLLRRDDTWIVKQLVGDLTRQYHVLNKSRRDNNDWKQTLYWVDAIHRFISLQKTFHNFGSYYDQIKKVRVNGTTAGFCKTYWDHIDNLNKDTFKKFTNALLPYVKKYGVSIIVLEELTSMYGNKLRSADDNRLYNLWPVGQLKEFLEKTLGPYNVAVVEVNEQDTSQIINGKWALRDKDILFNDTANVHADEQAAENIVDRALMHHTNLYSLYCINPIDEYYVPSNLWSPTEKGGKRIRGFLTKVYGTSDVVLIKQNNKFVKSPIDITTLKKMVGKKKAQKSTYLYRLDDQTWMDGDAKNQMLSSLSKSC